MAIQTNLETLDYPQGGNPVVETLSNTGIDPNGLTLTFGGAPFWASLGVVSTSVARVTQVVKEVLRDADDPGGGNLRVTQVARELLVENSEQVYVTQMAREVLRQNPAQAVYGKSWMVFDTVNTFEVTVIRHTLQSAASDLEVLNGANMALIGDEIIQFKTVTSLGGNRYRLSYLLRGRLGTEQYMNQHRTGERFVLLNAAIKKLTESTSDLDKTRLYRAPSSGQQLSSTFVNAEYHDGVALTPYAPCHVTGARDGSNNLTISWFRRTRVDGEWRDSVDVALGEATESYEVDILDGSGTVVRTITTTTPSAAYSAANQTTDFGAPQSAIAVAVYQMSAAVGRGYGTRKTV